MKKLVIANWKMNPRTEKEAVALARASDAKHVVVCPPFPFLPAVRMVLKRAALGSQDVASGVVGPRTGEVSAGELKALGIRYAIIGHSERRRPPAGGGETDAQIAEKVRGALKAGLTPILCVGEPWSVRKKGIAAARAFVRKQIRANLRGITSSVVGRRLLVIAYEPIWAISTTKNQHNETPEDAATMAIFIRTQLKTVNRKLKTDILYGGSVDSKNVAGFLARREFAGVLVGGASLKPSEFKKIIAAAGHPL